MFHVGAKECTGVSYGRRRVSHRCEEEIKEVTNPLVSAHRHFWRTVNNTVQSLRRQAPGARMVGEFAVKHAVSEAQRKLAPNNTPTSDTPGESES